MFVPKKSLSQNFLRDEDVLQNIVHFGEAQRFDWIIEIGAGEGALTAMLAKKTKRVLALEFDRDLIPILLKKFPLSLNVSIIESDILRADILDILTRMGFKNGDSWAIFGNIPYAITGKIIRMLVSLNETPDSIVIMIQKEVAERIIAKDGKQSILSISVALFGTTEILFHVSKNSFFPEPSVDSAIIRITPHKKMLSLEKREGILHFAKIGFASKRKTLANNFATHPVYSKTSIENFLTSLGKNKNVRAEELSADEWANFLVKITSPLL